MGNKAMSNVFLMVCILPNDMCSYNMADTLDLLLVHKDIVYHNHPEMILVIVLSNLMPQER